MKFNETWVVDFEFLAPKGERQEPICVVAQCVETGKTVKQWLEDKPKNPPFPVNENTLLVAYYSSAEWRCHLNLNWDLPQNVIDLYAEFRTITNGIPGIRRGLLAACSTFGIQSVSDVYKDGMRDRILEGPPYTDEEKQNILEYCASDVEATVELYKAMKPELNQDLALLRGMYMVAVAEMEYFGIPIDINFYKKLQNNFENLKMELITETDKEFGIYEGTTFKLDRFEDYLAKRGINWPRTETGKLRTDDDTFKDMVKKYPELQSLRDLRYILGQLKLNKLAVGSDGRNRCMLSPFGTKTGRNTPSNANFIFGPAVWLRGLIKPEPEKTLAYIDYSQQEFAIAAALSNDEKMKEAYTSGDPYLALAKYAGAAPKEATKETHKEVRDAFKACTLGVQYGMKSHSLAMRLGKTPAHAKELLRHHRRVFAKYWNWSEQYFNVALLSKKMQTCFGWTCRTIGINSKEDTIKNWPMQAAGAEILRIATIFLRQEGIKVIAPVHDALLVECYTSEVDEIIPFAQKLMEDASEVVLGSGNRVKTDVDLISFPDRYMDPRGRDTWDKVNRILDNLEGKK
ncbi:DNA polymerase [Methanosalsum natronophilum]|uniref:DNA polymerase n=1 Tax=Methanosalsum natronophilum TaxID=768733 RepID=UPI002169A407|nr:DNA polymerase [Methanosalsum natronophilum]MCS3924107.1 DNA polymerase I-like protein with 3'-5' exonuclease and polymerase domains [Methanosalsum natronophilum]